MIAYTHRHTLAAPLLMEGHGLHSGRRVHMRIDPAPAGHGLVFVRTDLPPGHGAIPAHFSHATPAALCTRLINAYGASVSTIEHLMAALHALGITDARMCLDSDEVPIMDGSAKAWMKGLQTSGLRDLGVPAPCVRVAQTVRVQNGQAWAQLRPNPARGLLLSCAIEFPDPAIGAQSFALRLSPAGFTRQLAAARTFCMGSDIRAMHAQGLALGGSPERALIFHNGRAINPEGLRFANEPVRHKMLDAVGDLFLAGHFIEGIFEANRPGHTLTGALVRALFSTPNALIYPTSRQARKAPVAA